MASPGVIGEEVIYSQASLIAKAAGAPDELAALNQVLQKNLFAMLKQNPDSAQAAEAIARLFVELKSLLTREERQALEATEGIAETESRISLMVSGKPLRGQQRVVDQQIHRRVDIGHQMPQARIQRGGYGDFDGWRHVSLLQVCPCRTSGRAVSTAYG